MMFDKIVKFIKSPSKKSQIADLTLENEKLKSDNDILLKGIAELRKLVNALS